VVGDWMGSQYDSGGRRYDYRLFLDHDGRYERTVRRELDHERKDAGRWFHDEADAVLLLESDTPDDIDRISSSWWVLSVRNCEDSNCILVLRWAALASRNRHCCCTGSTVTGEATALAGSKGLPNTTLQQTAAAVVVLRDTTVLSAAAFHCGMSKTLILRQLSRVLPRTWHDANQSNQCLKLAGPHFADPRTMFHQWPRQVKGVVSATWSECSAAS